MLEKLELSSIQNMCNDVFFHFCDVFEDIAKIFAAFLVPRAS